MSKEENKEIADFASWDKFSTSYDLVNLGTVTGTHGYSAELDLTTPAIGGVGATPKISTTGSLQEAAQLNSRYIVISGQIDPKKQKAVLQEQGAVGIDLAGTFTVNFEIRLDPGRGLPPHQRVAVIGPFSEEDKGGKSLAKDVNKIAKPESVKVDFANILYKRTADPITCKLSYDYTLRHVNGIDERELVEGLQSVQYLRGSVTVPGDIELVGRKDLLVTVYKIAIGPVGKYETGRMLALMNDEGKTLYFPTSESASEFLRWLKDGKSLTVAKYRLGVVDVTCQGGRHFSDKRPLKKEEVNQMIVHAEVLNPDEKYIAETQCP
jgi:hypothetical protein